MCPGVDRSTGPLVHPPRLPVVRGPRCSSVRCGMIAAMNGHQARKHRRMATLLVANGRRGRTPERVLPHRRLYRRLKREHRTRRVRTAA